MIKLGDNKPCLLPQNDLQNITDGTKLIFSSQCSGNNFMFRFGDQNSLVHTASGLCLSMDANSTAILSKNCREDIFEYKRLPRGDSDSVNLIVKHKKSGKCVRLKRDKATHHIKVSLRKCGDIFQILLVLTKSGRYISFQESYFIAITNRYTNCP